MTEYKITKAKGEGQGSCVSCNKKGKWNRTWVWSLYKIEGKDGLYCEECIKELKEEVEK